jgi:hypothetical protein
MGTNYYLRPDPCSECGRSDEEIHVGKQSFGWAFCWRGYDAESGLPMSVEEWPAFLRARVAAGDLFVDEYGTPVADLEDWLLARYHLRNDYEGTPSAERILHREFF